MAQISQETASLLGELYGPRRTEMPDSKKTEPDLVEVVVEFEGHTFTTYAATKKEGEQIIRDHIAAITDPQPAE